MSINNNIWEIAEVYLSGNMAEADVVELNKRLASDPEFANEFYEISNLTRSLEGSGKQKRFRSMLRDIHAEQTAAKPAARRINLSATFWRTAGVAASVALLTSTLTYTFLKPSIKNSDSQYNIIRREVDNIRASQSKLQSNQNKLENDIRRINTPPAAPVRYTGTGFAINNDGYFVTSYHVTNGADSVYIQDHNGDYYKASVQAYDENNDLAVLKVEKKNFHFAKGDVPYTFATGKPGLGEHIYTMGYPKDQVLYSEGYISGRMGYDGNENQYSLVLPAGHGQSGSPVVDERGNITAIVTAISGEAESNTYAVSAKALVELLHKKLPDNTVRLPHANKLGHLSRGEQIAKMEAFTFSVKVYKK